MKKSLKIIFGVLAVLLIVVALWRVSEYDSASPVQRGKTKKDASLPAEIPAVQAPSKYDEFLGGTSSSPRSKHTQAVPSKERKSLPPQGPVFITEKQPYPQQPFSQNSRRPYPARPHTTGNGRVVDTNFYSPDRAETTTPSASAPARVRSRGEESPLVSWSNSAAVQEERAGRVLAPFMRTDRKGRERMNAQWAKLSAAIDRAVFQALMPKSKKEAMIEKYAAKPAAAADPVMQASGLTGAFAPVGQALTVQKQEIVQDFASAFGGSAAQEAGSLMDAFASELGAALNTPGLTQEQAAKRVKEISKKYQDKMNKLSEQKQYDKFVADRLAQDNAQKQALNHMYHNDELNVQFGRYIDTASQQLQELAKRTDLSPEEQSAQYAQIEQDKRTGIQQAITASGQSLNPFYQWEQEQSQQERAKLKEKIENGEVESVARKASYRETLDMQNDFEAQKEKILPTLDAYSQTSREQIKNILDDYKNQLDQLYGQELSPEKRAEERAKKTNEANRQIIQTQMEEIKGMDLPAEWKAQKLAEFQQAYDMIPVD